MRRRNLINGALLAAAVGLGLLAWWLPAGQDDGAVLTPVAPSGVAALRLEYPPGASASDGGGRPALRLQRRDDGWHVTEPIARPARDGRIVTALGVLSARTRSCYAAGDRDLAEFGLATPRLILHVGETSVGFGDRAADGRRYVRSGERLCLIADDGYPLLARGLDGLAAPALLADDAVPVRIETPAIAATRADATAEWLVERGADARSADLRTWAARWQAARAQSFVLAPPAADHGRVRIETAEGSIHEWRIARPPPDPVLVPRGAQYGVTIAAAHGEALLRAPGEDARAE